MNILDDATLILQFVKCEGALVSNQSLRIEPAFDTVQLLAKRGGLIATIKTLKGVPTASLRRGSEYWKLIHPTLVENGFIPLNPSEKSEFAQYEQRKIPAGYKLNCAEARVLWKEWWTRLRQSNRNNIQTDLLIFCRNTWYPVRDISCNHGTLFITTLVTEFVYQGSELVVWPNKESNQAASVAQPNVPQPEKLAAPTNPSTRPGKPVFREIPGRTSYVSKEALSQTPPPLPVHGSSASNQVQQGNSTLRPDLREVLKFRQGKLYVTTPIGEVVVEGTNLKFWLNDDESSVVPKTININTYRDRDAHAVNS